MCNYKLPEHTIPKKTMGIGYKLFTYDTRTETLSSLVSKESYREFYKGANFSNIKWDEVSWLNHETGFCFFYNIKEARKLYKICRREFSKPKIYHISLTRIRYYKAFTRQIEYHFIDGLGVDVGLCKEFDILETLRHDPTAFTPNNTVSDF